MVPAFRFFEHTVGSWIRLRSHECDTFFVLGVVAHISIRGAFVQYRSEPISKPFRRVLQNSVQDAFLDAIYRKNVE